MVELKSFLMKGTEKIIPEINEILSEISIELAEILNLFSFRFFSFFNFALLGSPGKIFIKLFDN
jgi:hypothetical protein